MLDNLTKEKAEADALRATLKGEEIVAQQAADSAAAIQVCILVFVYILLSV